MLGFDITSGLIRSGISNRPSSRVRPKMECCKLHDHFGCLVTDCLATWTPSASIKSHHSQPIGKLVRVGGSLTPLKICNRRILQMQLTEQWCFNLKQIKVVSFRGIIIFTTPSARAGYDTRSIFKQNLTGLNSEYSFS